MAVLGRPGQATDHGQLITAAEDDVTSGRQWRQHGAGAVLRPESPAQVDVQADPEPVLPGQLDRGRHGGGRRGRQGRGHAGDVQPARRLEDPGGGRDILRAEPRASRSTAPVDDLRGTDVPPLPDHDAGRRRRVRLQVPDVDPLATQAPDDGSAQAVRTDAPDVGDRDPQARQARGDVGLRARDRPPEVGRLRHGAVLARHEGGHRLAQGHHRGRSGRGVHAVTTTA